MRKCINKYGLLLLLLLCTVSCNTPSKSSMPIKIEWFEQLNEVASKDFHFSYLLVYFTEMDIKLVYGVTGDNNAKKFYELKIPMDREDEGFNDLVVQAGLDRSRTSDVYPNILTNSILLNVFRYAWEESDICLKKHIDDDNNLNFGSIVIEVQEEMVDFIYSESQNTVGASTVCAFKLDPIREVESTRIVN